MKIEICQTNIIWENKQENINKAENIVKNSLSDVVLFPEMSFTGFSMNTDVTGENNCYTLNIIKNMAIKYNRAIGFGWVKKCDAKAENHYTFVDNRGMVLSDYVKIHPFSYSGEDKYFEKGTDITVFEYMGFKICNFICYDLRFPEIFQIASEKADVITVAANWPESRAEHWKTLLKARAIENLCYIVGINAAGKSGSLYYNGDSMVIAPDGTVLKDMGNKETTEVVEIINDVKKYRSDFPTKKDRQKELYKKITPEDKPPV